MSEIVISLIVCACLMSGALLGIWLRRLLPTHHVDEANRQVVTVAIGVLATLSALVLGLLVASAKASFDSRSNELTLSALRVVMVDRALRRYGPEAQPAREQLKAVLAQRIDRKRSDDRLAQAGSLAESDVVGIEKLESMLWSLQPSTNEQRWLHNRVFSLTAELKQGRWLLAEKAGSSIPLPFLVALVFWLTVIFSVLGLFAPRTATVRTVILVCALSVSTAVYMILEMDQPFEGIMQISDSPLRDAIYEVSRQ